MADKRYYWLKLKRDFFKRHDIRIIESMPNGKDYILFYLKLLCESVDHNGSLRFSEQIPYNEDMLATITNTNVDIVRNAINIFSQLGMMEILDDGTYFMHEVEKMLGSETYWAQKKREYRAIEQQQQEEVLDNVQLLSNSSPNCPSKSKSKSKSIEKDIEKDINIQKEKRFTPPSVEEVNSYILEKGYDVDAEAFVNFYESKGWFVGKNKMKSWKAALVTWNLRHRYDRKEDLPF